MRSAQYPIESIILNRWSAYAMSGESISDNELMMLFEAARWAPSSYNGQPWRFVYAKRDTSQWQLFLNLMVPFNQGWAQNAAVLIVVISKNDFEHNGTHSRTHSFDTGAAWQNLALQGVHMGLVVHAMEGFDYDKAKEGLNIPDSYTVEAMVAVGKPGNINVLDDGLQKKREHVLIENPLKNLFLRVCLKLSCH